MRICVPKEITDAENRVAATPDSALALKQLGFEIWVESSAGKAAGFPDKAYGQRGIEVITNTREIWSESDILLKVLAPNLDPRDGLNEIELIQPGQTVIGLLSPSQNPELLKELANRGVTAIAIDAVPRVSRAQKLDALSAMANIAGYRAVVEAAHHFGKFFCWASHSCRKDPAGKSTSYRSWSSRPSRHWRCNQHGRNCQGI